MFEKKKKKVGSISTQYLNIDFIMSRYMRIIVFLYDIL